MKRPHVVMFSTGDLPFGTAWADAARRIASVTVIERGGCDGLEGSTIHVASSPLYRARPSRLFRPLAELDEARRFVRAIQEVQRRIGPVDLLHGHFYTAAEPVRLAARMAGLPFVHTEHSSAFLSVYADRRRTLTRAGLRRARRVFRDAARVVAVSDALRTGMTTAAGGVRIDVIGNPVDTAVFMPAHDRPPRAGRSHRIVYVGRLSDEKGIAGIIRACERLQSAFSLEIIGDGPQRAQVEQLISRSSDPSRYLLRGRVEHSKLPGILSAADTFVSNSSVETFGVAVAEAMACGCRVVCPAIPALLELTAGHAITFDPKRPEALGEAISRAESEEAPDRTAARRHIENHYSHEVVGEALRRVYGSVLGGEV